MKASILVAIYNAGQTLPRCLDSLLSQTHTDLEIICIDDASTDRSASIVSDYASRDNRIVFLRNATNQGPAVARNKGLEVATGDIIGFLDSDDWYAPDTVARLVKVFREHDDADCVLYRCIHVDEEGREGDYQGISFDSMPGKEAFRESLTWNIHGVYAARKALFLQCPYDASRRHFSDDNTTRIHYYLSRMVYQSDAPYYYYTNPQSISHQVSVSRMDYLAATASMKRQLLALGCDHSVLCVYEDVRLLVLVDCYLFYYQHRNRFSEAERHCCLSELRNAWQTIDSSLLSPSLARKFGYNPCPRHWLLFRLQEESYFFLRHIFRYFICQIKGK